MNASGLSTDIFFIAALKSNDALMELLPAHDVYNNVANPDEDLDNVDMPYLLVNNDGGQNVAESKDDDYESLNDRVQISVRVCACNRKQLDELATAVRKTIHDYIREMDDIALDGGSPENYDLKPYDYEFSFSDIAYMPDKPCYNIMLYYQCEVMNRLIINDDEQEE